MKWLLTFTGKMINTSSIRLLEWTSRRGKDHDVSALEAELVNSTKVVIAYYYCDEFPERDQDWDRLFLSVLADLISSDQSYLFNWEDKVIETTESIIQRISKNEKKT